MAGEKDGVDLDLGDEPSVGEQAVGLVKAEVDDLDVGPGSLAQMIHILEVLGQNSGRLNVEPSENSADLELVAAEQVVVDTSSDVGQRARDKAPLVDDGLLRVAGSTMEGGQGNLS